MPVGLGFKQRLARTRYSTKSQGFYKTNKEIFKTVSLPSKNLKKKKIKSTPHGGTFLTFPLGLTDHLRNSNPDAAWQKSC